MIKFIIGLIIFGLIALAIIILIVINFTYKGVRQMRKAVEDQYELHQKRKEQADKNTARRTTTSSGVTIIDEREADKKIFSHDDGEYVEFEEV